MTLFKRTNVIEYTATAVNTDANGKTTITLPVIGIDKVIAVRASGGYKAGDPVISGNQVTVTIYQYDYDAAGDGAAIPVANGTGVCDVTVIAKVY